MGSPQQGQAMVWGGLGGVMFSNAPMSMGQAYLHIMALIWSDGADFKSFSSVKWELSTGLVAMLAGT